MVTNVNRVGLQCRSDDKVSDIQFNHAAKLGYTMALTVCQSVQSYLAQYKCATDGQTDSSTHDFILGSINLTAEEASLKLYLAGCRPCCRVL